MKTVKVGRKLIETWTVKDYNTLLQWATAKKLACLELVERMVFDDATMTKREAQTLIREIRAADPSEEIRWIIDLFERVAIKREVNHG